MDFQSKHSRIIVELNEESPEGNGFLAIVCQDWESEVLKIKSEDAKLCAKMSVWLKQQQQHTNKQTTKPGA